MNETEPTSKPLPAGPAYPLPGSIARPDYAPGEREALIEEIRTLLKAQDAVLVAHYYTDEDLQMIADETGGTVADSLEMARFGNTHPASTLVVAGPAGGRGTLNANLAATGGAIHADDRVASLDDWPAWTREAMTTEARRLKFRRVETPDDSVRTRLPGKTEAPQAMDDGWYFISDIKAESPLECYLFTSSRDLATLIDVIAEASIEAIAGGHDNAGNRRVFHIGAGEVAGLPYLSLEWIYTVQQDGQTMVGFTKVRAAAKGDRAFACNHNYLGYRETFARAFAEFVTSTDMDDMTTQPFYEEIARLDMNGFGTGVVYASYSTDDEGDIHMYASEASLMPVDAATISTSDSWVNGLLR